MSIRVSLAGMEQGIRLRWSTVSRNLKATIEISAAGEKAIKGTLGWSEPENHFAASDSEPRIRRFLPNARIELYRGRSSKGRLKRIARQYTNETGEFHFGKVPEHKRLALKIFLEHKDSKIVVVKGMPNQIKDEDVFIQNQRIVWHLLQINVESIRWEDGNPHDFGHLEIHNLVFLDLCRAYRSIFDAHSRVIALTGIDLPLCQINYPSPEFTQTHNRLSPDGEADSTMRYDQISITPDLAGDRCVHFHEYGHVLHSYVADQCGYHDALFSAIYFDYVARDTWDKLSRSSHDGSHLDSKEHYEVAWTEGVASYLSTVLANDSKMHRAPLKSYDDFAGEKFLELPYRGAHCAGSVAEALWFIQDKIASVENVTDPFREGFWEAFRCENRSLTTIFEFFDNWKEKKCPGLDVVKEAITKFGFEYGYRYSKSARFYDETYPPDKATDSQDEKVLSFSKLEELFNKFGSEGNGTEAEYKEEFFNRNMMKYPHLAEGSTVLEFKCKPGHLFRVPERFKYSIE